MTMNKLKLFQKSCCEICGKTSGLVVHHKDCSRKFGVSKMNNDPTNLVTLCFECHGLEHSKLDGRHSQKLLNQKIDNNIKLQLLKFANDIGISRVQLKRNILLNFINKQMKQKKIETNTEFGEVSAITKKGVRIL